MATKKEVKDAESFHKNEGDYSNCTGRDKKGVVVDNRKHVDHSKVEFCF